MKKKPARPLWSGNIPTAYIKPSWISDRRLPPQDGHTPVFIDRFLWSNGEEGDKASEPSKGGHLRANGTKLCLNANGTINKLSAEEDTVGLWCEDEIFVPRCCGGKMVKLKLSPDGEDWVAKCPKCRTTWTLGEMRPSFFLQEDGSLTDPSGLSVGLWDEEGVFIPEVPERNRKRYPAMKKFSVGISKAVPKENIDEGDEIMNVDQLKDDIFSMLEYLKM